MTALAIAVVGAYGVHLVHTALTLHWTGLGPGPRAPRRPSRRRLEVWLAQAGLEGMAIAEFGAAIGVIALLGGACGYVVFAGPVGALGVAVFAGSFPLGTFRSRRRTRRAEAQQAWPRLIEELRILTGSLGRSVPQALLEVGRGAPDEMQPAFAAAHREWLVSTDFPRTIALLKSRLADPSADATCETLLVAHELGGADLDRRLAALAEDRTQDVQGRKDARARQAGVRFARRFVLIVPLGMALAGMSVGNGRGAYATPGGQAAIAAGLGLVALCWAWAGAILRIPDERRVFAS